ncbi:MAG: aspartate kinase [Anaerolineaceae bacterium]|nr:aspartate kinase [Anaerolineaceae bacterium]
MKLFTMKFGGTSVGSPEAMAQVVEIVKGDVDAGHGVIVVVSAMSGVTDSLIDAARKAASGNKWGYLSTAETLRERHTEALEQLTDEGEDRDRTLAQVNALIDDFVNVCNAINILGELTPRMMDAIVSFGERLSSRVIAAAMRAQGVQSRQYDASQFIVTDDHYQSANPLWADTESNIRNHLLPVLEEGITPIITGFIGQTQDGVMTTLGRGGSDYSGAIFAAASDSDELIIWTDVDGVMTTDPRIDKRARVLPYVSYNEVGELAFYGAKVLHPKTVQPILDKKIPMRVRNTFNPTFEGTLIGPASTPSATVIKAVTAVRNVGLLTVSGRGMIGVPGIAGRAFLTTAKAGANILMISQASSEQSFCFVVMDDRSSKVKAAIEQEFVQEIAQRNIDQIELLEDVVILTVVGSGMRGTPGIAGRVFNTMGAHDINVVAIAQGASECSISFVIDEINLERAVIALHELALEAVAVV